LPSEEGEPEGTCIKGISEIRILSSIFVENFKIIDKDAPCCEGVSFESSMLFKKQEEKLEKAVEKCPYCQGTKIVKKGRRKKKMEEVQVYFCNHCQKKFTPQITKGRTYPLRIILEVITLHNRLKPTVEIVKKIKER